MDGAEEASGSLSALASPSGDVVGTLRVLPPERLQGRSDAAGDIYSFGRAQSEQLVKCHAEAIDISCCIGTTLQSLRWQEAQASTVPTRGSNAIRHSAPPMKEL